MFQNIGKRLATLIVPKGAKPALKMAGDRDRSKASPGLAQLRESFIGQPAGWASDHRAESGKYTGWNDVAIRAQSRARQRTPGERAVVGLPLAIGPQ